MEDLFIHGVGHKYHSKILDLYIVVALMSTLPFGGCHGLLLGCSISNIILCIRVAIWLNTISIGISMRQQGLPK